MISIGANGNKISYGIKHYNMDTTEDLINFPRHLEQMGCTCFVISTSKYYMLNSKLEWVEINPYGSGNNPGGGGGGDTPGEGEHVVYDGGDV